MINVPAKLLKEVQDGLKTQKDIETYLLEKHTISEIITAFAELLIISDDLVNKPQIAVTEDEYKQITSLFRIKGMREINGVVCEERRGRPSKQKIEKA